MTDARLLEPGMLLLDPETYSTPHIWTVTRVAQKSATVIAHYGTCHAEAKLRTPRLPEGWQIIEHHPLAALLAAQYPEPGSNAAPDDGAATTSERTRSRPGDPEGEG